MSEREIRVCPVCRCADFETARGGFGSRETPTRHSCNCCGERFDEPATRPPKRDGGLRGDSLAAALDDADPDDLVTDGGRDVESSSGVSLSDVLDVVDDVESEVVDEDKMGASREQVAEGTCERVRRRLKDELGVPCRRCEDSLVQPDAGPFNEPVCKTCCHELHGGREVETETERGEGGDAR